MKPEPADRTSQAHPDFDGHLERPPDLEPLNAKTFVERLRRAWEGTLLLQWARRVKFEQPRTPKPDR